MNSRTRQDGLTLPEVLVAAVVLSLAMVGGSFAVSHAASARSSLREDPITAAMMAREIHEIALTLPVTSGDPTATLPTQITALDTLDGARFSPPLSATKQPLAIARPNDWAQEVSLSTHALTDLAAAQVLADVPKHSDTLIRLTVAVTHRGAQKGIFHWWLNP